MNERHDLPPAAWQSLGTPPRPRSPSEALEPQRAPDPPRGGRVREPSSFLTALASIGSGLFTLAVVGMVAAGLVALVLGHFYERPGPLAEAKQVVIENGAGRIEIAETLEKQGVISSRWAFVLNHMLRNLAVFGKPLELKAGEYEFKPAATLREVREAIAEGRALVYKVTVPEGLTSQQIVERLNADPNLSGQITQLPPEGTLLPDTHHVPKGMNRQDLIALMQAKHAEFLAEAWARRSPDVPVSSPREAVILASIVEKETGRADERERVAAVFVNRLNKKMRLQSDPTIIYGIVGGQGSLGRSITRTDIDTKTDYNTYKINGLPPGPICNPGREAIMATLNPAKTNDLYFVADGTGGHTFSDTLQEHNAAVQTWRKIEKDQQPGADDPAAGNGAAAEQPAEGPAKPQAKPATQPAPKKTPTAPTVINKPQAEPQPPPQ